MSRAQRLLDLIQQLRGYRRPVSGAVLAGALGISLRTLYRDIETLNAQGAHIDGEPGVATPQEEEAAANPNSGPDSGPNSGEEQE